MKDLYTILYNLRNSDRAVYEIVPNDEEIKYKKLINNISNMGIDPRIKKFFIEQVEFKAGSFTYKDLYRLVNEYIIKIKNNNTCPYKNLYPIIIDEKTYINNIALFIACLKLNLKPVCIEYNFIPQIEDKPGIIKDHSFGVCSSGSVKRKIISLYEEKAINNSDSFITNDHSVSYCTNTITGIVGISSIILEPLIVHSKVIINNKNNFFDEISERKSITHVMLPVDFKRFLKFDYNHYSFNPNIQFILGGSYVSPNSIEDLIEYLDLSINNICLVYGQTETYGLISRNNFGSQRAIVLDLLSKDFLKKRPHVFRKNIIKKSDYTKIKFNKTFSLESYVKKNKKENGKMYFLSSGRINPKRVKLSSRPIGEIIVDGYATGDIGYIDINKYLYVLYRKDNIYSLLINFLKSRGYDSSYDFQNKKLLFNCGNEEGINLDTIDYINYGWSSEIRDVLKSFNISNNDIKFVKINRSSNLKKLPTSINNGIDLYDYSLLSKNIYDIEKKILMYILKEKNLAQILPELYFNKISKENIVLYLTIFNVNKIIELISNDCKKDLYNLPNIIVDDKDFNDDLSRFVFKTLIAKEEAQYVRYRDDLVDDDDDFFSEDKFYRELEDEIRNSITDVEFKQYVQEKFWDYFFEVLYNYNSLKKIVENVEKLDNKEEIYDKVNKEIKRIVIEIEEMIKNEYKFKSL